MAREITIAQEQINGETFKVVTVEIDGKKVSQVYTYPTSTDDSTIESEVDADLDAKNYPE